jgi:hypothetical protein
MKPNVIKIASIGLSLIGAAVSVAAGFVEDKKLDAKVAEKVAEALNNK